MKIKMTIIAGLFVSVTAFGQFQSHLTQLKTSERDRAFAEVLLIHRLRNDPQKIEKLGSAMIMIPDEIKGKKLKIENYRFRTSEGYAFKMDGQTYVQVQLFYDSETSDPRDDIFIVALPFEVDEDLVESELNYYEGREFLNYNFKDAPNGKPAYETGKAKPVKE